MVIPLINVFDRTSIYDILRLNEKHSLTLGSWNTLKSVCGRGSVFTALHALRFPMSLR